MTRMYRMLIVDDNPGDRRELEHFLAWETIGIEIVGIFSHGQQVLDNISRLQPDLIIADIAMPGMNGIELAQKLKKISPKTKMIFLSCHNNFDFARKAINLDIYSYLLKPIIENELKDAIMKVLNISRIESIQCKEKEALLHQISEAIPFLQEQFFRELALGTCFDVNDIQKRLEFLTLDCINGRNAQIAVLKINHYQHHVLPLSVQDKYLVSHLIRKIIDNYSSEDIRLFNFQVSAKEYVLLAFLPLMAEDRHYNILLEVISEIHEKISRDLGIETTISISKSSQTLTELNELYQQALNALQTILLDSDNQIILYREIEDVQCNPFEWKIDFKVLYNEVQDALYGNERTIDAFITKYFGGKKSLSDYFVKSFLLASLNIMQILFDELYESFRNVFTDELVVWKELTEVNNLKDAQQWLKKMLMDINYYLKSKQNDKSQLQIVIEIKRIIKERYHGQLTISEIAQSVHFSVCYANDIFRRETKQTIFDYLTNFRMEKAKELLRIPAEKIYLIVEKVGYVNKSHFSLLFRRYTGLTPTEYREQFIHH